MRSFSFRVASILGSLPLAGLGSLPLAGLGSPVLAGLGSLVLAACSPDAGREVAPQESTGTAKQALLYTPFEGKLLGTDLAAGGFQGFSVAISGDTAVVGGAKEFYPWSAGGAYVFVRSGSTWTQQAKLTPASLGGDDRYGNAVAIDGDTIAVGAPSFDAGGRAGSGSVFIYVRSGTTWTEQARITPTDSAAFDGFGYAVALSGDVVLAGAPWKVSDAGAAYVFTRSGTAWTQSLKLSNGVAGEMYGRAVAIGGNYYAIGAPGNDVKAFDAGAVYIVQKVGGYVTTRQPDAVANGWFGKTLATNGSHLAIGAPDGSTGTVYVFTQYSSTWGDIPTKLTGGSGFGTGLAMNDTMLAVGDAYYSYSGANTAGRVVVYNRSGWAEDAVLSASDRAASDNYGAAVALTNDTLVIGAPGRDDKGTDSGAAYVHRVIAEKAKGAACTVNDECASKYCVDGVCCVNACNTRCVSCAAAKKASGADGDCGPTKDGLVEPGDCTAAACTGTTLTNAQVCDGAANCKSGGSVSCGLYTCASSGSACNTTCTTDAQCAAGAWCEAGSCKADLDDGAACARAAQCKTGFCVDGVCCDAACTGKCEACTTAKKGAGANGKCDPVAADSDPDNECAAATGEPCGLPGTCDGLGACRLYAKSGTVCGATSCVDGKVTGKVCNGAGACGDATGVSCGAYACSGTSCKTACTDATAAEDCAATAYCTAAGTCAPKRANGTSCAAGKECTSGFCVDGVCCASTCSGQCEACNETGTEGACVPVSGAPRGTKRPPCSGDPATCGGKCNGINAAQCDYPAATKDCGTRCEGSSSVERTCDGKGECVAKDARSCAPFACDTNGKCRTTCAADTDCTTGNRCADGTCAPTGGAKCLDPTQSQSADGKTVPCGAYKCDELTGGCKQVCTDSADCATTHLCNATTKTCEPAAAPTTEDSSSGCGCETGVGRASSFGLAAIAFLSAVVARRLRAGPRS
ncbi:MAG: FG-GAP repeat protein [Deltaproteobacteria bacterium]|nr:FG-GAP repeat protein [Deltaproteobacteria bacterium]